MQDREEPQPECRRRGWPASNTRAVSSANFYALTVACDVGGAFAIVAVDAVVDAVMAGRALGFCFGGHQEQHLQNLHHYYLHYQRRQSRGRPLRACLSALIN